MELTEYQSEILFLLVGKNPLPNYVAAKLLAKQFSNNNKPVVCLLYSDDTEEYAKNLSDVLGEEYDCKKLLIDPRKYSSVENKVNSYVNEIKNHATEKNYKVSVGLNYTGGTKAMSVHAYRAIELLKSKIFDVHFSYLDSDKKLMRVDVKEEDREVSFDLSDVELVYFEQTKISLDELLKLHGWKKYLDREKPRTEVRYEKIVKALYEVSQNKNEWESWSDFRGKKIKKLILRCRNTSQYNGTSTKNQNEYEDCLKEQVLNIQNIPKTLETAFQTHLTAEIAELNLANLPNTTSVEELCDFLMGTWLEDFVLEKILSVKDECKLHDVGTSLEVRVPKIRDEIKFFELDVVAMRGYQLFAISCTLDNKVFNCKKKLFEVVHRAKQLGGAEARIGLVSLANDSAKRILETQLKEDNIKVFGISDLENLDKKLNRWFNQ